MKKLLFNLVYVFAALWCAATPVTPKAAQRVAQNFWQAVSEKDGALEGVLVADASLPHLYIFDFRTASGESRGFVIVSADDCAYPILGYAADRPASGEELPTPVRFWLGQYEQEIAYLSQDPARVDSEAVAYVAESWSRLLDGTFAAPKSIVYPLLTTIWNQSPYYNALCPGGSPVGCSATATSQVMKYWNHPRRGMWSNTYYSSTYGSISADFNTVYDWEHMPNELTASSDSIAHAAVSKLCYHVGVAMNMDYHPDGSGADIVGRYGRTAESALVNNFGYKNTLHGESKRRHTDAQWNQYIMNDLNARRPIVYAGFDNNAGHAFVFDGYNSLGLYHVNWGWGGIYDGYFAMGALNPGGGGIGSNSSNSFNQYNQAIFGIEPLPALGANCSNIILPHTQAHATVQVSGNNYDTASWHASCDASWLQLSTTSGGGSGIVTNMQLIATDNTGATERHAVVTFTQGTDTAYLQVSQILYNEEEMCNVNVNMYADGTHGWCEGYLTLASPGGTTFGTVRLSAGAVAQSASVQVVPDTLVVTWHSGSNDSCCGFYLENAAGNIWVEHRCGDDFPVANTFRIANPCSSDGATGLHTYSLDVQTNDTLYGHASGSGDGLAFGSEVNVTAYANPGCRFVGWSNGVTSNPMLYTVIEDASVTALFQPLGTDTMTYASDVQSRTYIGEGSFSYGIRIPKESLPGHLEVTGVDFYIRHTGTYTVKICSGEEEGPGDVLYTRTVTSSLGWIAGMRRNTTVPVQYNKDLWVVIDIDDPTIPYSDWCGNSDGGYLCEDGINWTTLENQGHYGSWMIRVKTSYDSTRYTLNVRSDDPASGSATGSGSYLYGTRVSCYAEPQPGHHFDHWSDRSTTNPHIVSVRNNTSITAFFAEGDPVGIEEAAADVRYRLEGRRLTVLGHEAQPLQLYDMQGRCVYRCASYDGKTLNLPSAGVYLIRLGQLPAVRVVAY